MESRIGLLLDGSGHRSNRSRLSSSGSRSRENEPSTSVVLDPRMDMEGENSNGSSSSSGSNACANGTNCCAEVEETDRDGGLSSSGGGSGSSSAKEDDEEEDDNDQDETLGAKRLRNPARRSSGLSRFTPCSSSSSTSMSTDIASTRTSCSSHHHHRNHRHYHHHPLLRAKNYCQFETPADESRGTFPDDFDEEMFIKMNTEHQLGEARNEPSEFYVDEDLDPNNQHRHHALDLDTADHSESSDIDEENVYSGSSSSESDPTSAAATMAKTLSLKDRVLIDPETSTPTSSRAGAMTLRLSLAKNNREEGNEKRLFAPFGDDDDDDVGSSSLESTTSIFAIAETEFLQDLNSCYNKKDNGINSKSVRSSTASVAVGVSCNRVYGLVDESYSHEDTEEDCFSNDTSSADVETKSSSSSLCLLRKRKCSSEVEYPTKKTVTDDSCSFTESSSMTMPIEDGDEQCSDADDICDVDIENFIAAAASPDPCIPFDPSPAVAEWLNTFVSWTSVERLNAVNNLIQVAERSEIRHMMRVIEPQFQRDFISLLPKELALYVLSFLEPKDLLQAAQTCRYWRILCDDSLLWKEKCREAGIGPFSAMAQRIHNRRVRGGNSSSTNGLWATRVCPGAGDNNCISSCEPWKAAYLRQHNVEMNWRFQPIRPAKTLKGHDDHVITCLQFSANRIVSGSDDNTLKVWSATTGKCLRTLVGHTGGVWSSQMSGTTVVSGSTDRTLRVWNAETGTCLHTLYGHTSTVRCMHLFERKVVSGSRDATLRVWNVDTGECLHVLVGHLAAVRCVQYNGKIVVSGAYDYMVRVWDVEREECLHQLQGHSNRVYSLQFDGIHVVSGSLDTQIRVWDVRTGDCKHTLVGHQSLTSGMELRDNLLVSGNADSTVKIWDINTGQCLLTLAGPNKHLSAVTCLQLINKFVITSSDDGTVKLWDIATGEFVRNLVTLSSGGSGGVVWRIRASETKLVCAVGSRNGTEETKLLVLDFDVDPPKPEDVGKADASTSTTPLKTAASALTPTTAIPSTSAFTVSLSSSTSASSNS